MKRNEYSGVVAVGSDACPGAIPSESTLMHGPVVQRQRLLSYKQETMVQLHPGLLSAQVRQLAERLGLNPRDCRFESCAGHMRLGRQLADHLGLEPGMLWVRIPPELLKLICPRGAAWSARLPVTQEIVGSNPIGDARQHGTQTGKAAKLKPS